jgi:hypothetical protein
MGATASNEKHGKARNGTGKRYSEGFLGFVDIPLSTHDKEQLETWTVPGQVEIDVFLETVANEGYKFSLVTDFEHSSSIATVTGKADACVNKGYALSARGPDPLSAIVVLWYKMSQIAEWREWVKPGADGPKQLDMFR